MKREDVKGLEFDWFAIDQDEHIAVFCSAGFGEIPNAVIETYSIDDDFEIKLAMKRLPVIGISRDEGPQDVLGEWRDFAMRGAFVYDWSNESKQYARIALPSNPVQFRALPQEMQNIFRLVQMKTICFLNALYIAGLNDIER